jgi:predicted permease
VTALEARQGELSVRAAIGAGAGRLARQLATESLAIAVVGGLAGIVLSRFALVSIPALLPASVPFLTPPGLDLRVGAVGMGAAVVSGLLLAAWPIGRLAASRPQPRGVFPRPRSFVYRTLVVSQIAITVALVVASGLLAQSLWSVQAEEPGFVVRNVLVADLTLPGARYAKATDVVQFEQRLVEALASTAGVHGVATAYDHPLETNWTQSFRISGDTARDAGEVTGQAELRIVSPGYFDALGVEVLDGRRLTESDDWSRPGAAVVNEAFARRFGTESPVLGRRLQSRVSQFAWGDEAPGDFGVVGIVENERFRGLEEAALPAVYLSTRQFPQRGFTVLVRTATNPLSFAGQVRTVVRRVDAQVASGTATSLEAILSEQLAARRVTTDVIGGFASAALGLAALGLYGLLAVVVAGRTREIGVRLALGASPASVARHIVGESLRNVVAGVAVGIGLALLAGWLLQGLLVGVTARDPATLAVVAGTLAVVGLVAALGPAGRAARIDPARALRAE